MKRIIVHLIRGEAKIAHEAITRDLADKFDSFPIHERIVPHLTIKRWFELNDEGMEKLYSLLDVFSANHFQSDYRLHGFNNFGPGVIYVDVEPAEETTKNVSELMQELHTIEGLTFDEYDALDNDLHATVAMRALKPFDFDQVWTYLKDGSQPDFQMKFDNIAILERNTERWVPNKVWELKEAGTA